MIKLSIVLLMLTSHSVYSQHKDLQQVEFLLGTWKMEGKESYESWEKKNDILTGVSYKIENRQKTVSEKIEVKMVGGQIIYAPTVFDQNDGKAIPFKLESLEQNLFSFENPEHDFPKKIQYQILSDNELYVSVLGEKDEGFSYKLIRQVN
ncbi:hypothetical protein FNH22_08005 [Fulvivirga sp. M361]|uniref:DUF6265 family protein n=1 Tax=Fulvivirga sp. M361 TaxID=2594266 RepID=UPI00117B3CAB|nr:DUF6265 family protein [Fulvivirga sp. M361]TRX59988.1 hypothetical protein FNH22_08005 [Fulvivirga sp. M361]